MILHGKNRIGFELSHESGKYFQTFNPATLHGLPDKFAIANEFEVEKTMTKAHQASMLYRNKTGIEKAVFLETIADEIMNLGDELIQMACAETGLPVQRITGERGRTVNQLRMFADLIKEGSWVDASIDRAMPERQPLPKPDIRRMLRPLGPVVVFTASNFPLAFSTAGGDTASAFAAGNPVIVKAHPSHAGTNMLIGEAINNAAEKSGMPDGVFSTLYSNTHETGLKLVMHPITKAVGFTGSFNGGMALYKAAVSRENPIPVFAEMGSVNPVILLPEKVKHNVEETAKVLAGSITNGAGQFCTKPGLIGVLKSPELSKFLEAFSNEIEGVSSQTMLNKGIWSTFNTNRKHVLNQKGVDLKAGHAQDQMENQANPAIATVSYQEFEQNSTLHKEVFGPFSLIVICENMEELEAFVINLEGQLTLSVFGMGDDFKKFKYLFPLMEEKAGRVIVNNPPTGVEVCHSIHHGGPFPASTDSRFTSVGTDAIKRFARPVSYQNFPHDLLPEELRDDNPLKIWRKVDGKMMN